MLADVLKKNKTQLCAIGSYISPQIDTMTDLFRKIEKDAGSEFHSAVKHTQYYRNEYLQKEGRPCAHVWLLEKGITRTFRNNSGEEVTFHFSFPGEFIVPYKSFAAYDPATANIQFLTDGWVYTMSWSNLQKLKCIHPELAEMEKLDFECRKWWYEDRINGLMAKNAKERYRSLEQQYPEFIKILPLNCIASYLDETPETISRIRARKR